VVRWQDVIDSELGFAAEVQKVFDAHKHKTIATLRADGSPRISGVEFEFRGGDVVFGMMPRSLKARDLRRDPRTELHSASVDTPEDDPMGWPGDARLSGRAVEVTDPEERRRLVDDPDATYPLFVLDIECAVRIKLDGNPPHLLVRTWRPGRPLKDAFAD
jgi:hypothetical protein